MRWSGWLELVELIDFALKIDLATLQGWRYPNRTSIIVAIVGYFLYFTVFQIGSGVGAIFGKRRRGRRQEQPDRGARASSQEERAGATPERKQEEQTTEA